MRWLLLLAMFVGGCRGGPFRPGDQLVAIEAAYGDPNLDNPIWWVGDGDAPTYAVTVKYSRYFRDRLAWTVGLTPARIFDQSDGTVWSAELQAGIRWDFVDFTVYRVPIVLYGIALGGIMHSSKSVPAERGSHTNLTQDLGLGFEFRWTDSTSMVAGYRLKHLSNGSGSNLDNPSQNSNDVFLGLVIRW